MLKVEDIERDKKNPNNVTNIYVSYLFDNNPNKEKIKLQRHLFETTYKSKIKYNEFAVIKQFPITLGYAITSHAVQGKTLTCKVGVDLTDASTWDLLRNIFFVAMTRVRESSQLYMDKHPARWITNLGQCKYIDKDTDDDTIKNELQLLWNKYDNNNKRQKICHNKGDAINPDTYKMIISMYPNSQ